MAKIESVCAQSIGVLRKTLLNNLPSKTYLITKQFLNSLITAWC